MGYRYEDQKSCLFTESGTATLLSIRDEAKRLIQIAGACTAARAVSKATGDGWTMLAALDYMVERGELRRVTPEGTTCAQDQVFTSPALRRTNQE